MIVSFPVPDELVGRDLHLVDESGRTLPVQLSARGEASTIVEALPAGASVEYHLVGRRAAANAGADPGVETVREGNTVTLTVAEQPVLRYTGRPTELPRPDIDPVFQRGGYIHPVWTPSEKVITGDYPADHLHHHGIWAAWTNTVFEGRKPDFWNMGDRTGTVLPVAIDSVWSGPVHGGLIARHRYVDLSGEAPADVLHETWTVRVYNVSGPPDPSADDSGRPLSRPYRIFDLEVVQTTASSSPLGLPEYRYGGVGFRGRDEWNGAPNAFFLTSEGKDRSDGHATRARWAHISGHVDGELAGIGILADPRNFRFPEPMRIHPSEPFFNWAPSQLGEWSIEPGTPFVARYRYVVTDGGPDSAELERLWNDFANPPAVTVSKR